jgi:AcrR family transcriptional regulator
MAHAKFEANIVIERLMNVFRSVGYDGASLAELASATGLKKASLYHRFPEGKLAMADAVLDYVIEWTNREISEVLFSSMPGTERLDAALNSIYMLYDGGRLACILRAMSQGTAGEIFRDKIADIFQRWLTAFTHLATDLGHEVGKARRLGESTVIKIQGALILGQTLQRPEIFQNVLIEVKNDFI